ncbi:hypothetical protein HY490_02880 [Candidatus Woesearchaeota archaeon]|nr:hypothetical protein [Candidatus Woesearchaeota archaeon]
MWGVPDARRFSADVPPGIVSLDMVVRQEGNVHSLYAQVMHDDTAFLLPLVQSGVGAQGECPWVTKSRHAKSAELLLEKPSGPIEGSCCLRVLQYFSAAPVDGLRLHSDEASRAVGYLLCVAKSLGHRLALVGQSVPDRKQIITLHSYFYDATLQALYPLSCLCDQWLLGEEDNKRASLRLE